MLKAITLYDPWGSLMAIGAKINETRPVRTLHRGDICIHIAKTDYGCSDEVARAAIKAYQSRDIKPEPAFGCIVAVVNLYDVLPVDRAFVEEYFDATEREELIRNGQVGLSDEEWKFGNYSEGRFFYRTRNLRRLKTPVPCRGCQAVNWTVPPDVEALVKAQLSPQCSFGACSPNRCTNVPLWQSTLHGKPNEMFWCEEHHHHLTVENPTTPGHGFIKHMLCGKNLACWCKAGQPCHCDILLKIANE